MSSKGIESVLTRAMSDTAFAEALFAEADKALAGFDLTVEEIAGFKAMSRADFDKLISASPEERKSFILATGFNHSEGILQGERYVCKGN